MDWDQANGYAQVAAVDSGNRNNTTSGYIVLPSDVRTRWVDPTLMATRTFLTTFRWTVSPNTQIHAGAGLIMWQDVNDSPPTGADCPDPLRDGDLDWINRWVSLHHSGESQYFGGSPNIFDITHLSKAKRRFGQNAGLLMCFSAMTIGGSESPTIGFNWDVRALIKE